MNDFKDPRDSMLGPRMYKIFGYFLLSIFAVMSILPFWITFVNATRSTVEIQQRALSLIPSTHLLDNFKIYAGKAFNPLVGFRNSMIISVCTTALATYFSCLTAYALVAYNWKLKQGFFTFIVVVMIIPAQVTTIGFYQFMWQIGLINNFIPLIIPAVASPAIVFFMRQYLMATFSPDIVNSARIDGGGEFRIFNQIIIPIMMPAIATQAIFIFVSSWNNFFMPTVLLTRQELFTMPIMVTLLRGDIYRTELGSVYLGISATILPLFVMYFALSRYIIAGVQLGGVKE